MYLFAGTKVKYKGDFYRPIGGLDDDVVKLYPLGLGVYDDFEVQFNEIEMIFATRIWVSIRGCEAIWEGFDGDKVKLNVRPSNDVNILEAKQVERGVFKAKLPKSEIKRMYEERYELGEFPFPDNLERIQEIDLNEIL